MEIGNFLTYYEDRKCTDCAPGKYSPDSNQIECNVQPTCQIGEHMSSPGSSITKKICTLCTDKSKRAEGEFIHRGCRAQDDAMPPQYLPCSLCGPGKYMVSQCVMYGKYQCACHAAPSDTTPNSSHTTRKPTPSAMSAKRVNSNRGQIKNRNASPTLNLQQAVPRALI